MASFDPRYRQESVAGNLTMTLYRIGQAIALLLREKGLAHGLSSTQLQSVLFLAYARPDVCSIGGLAERLGCTPATASGVVDALERKGLATRQQSAEHGRTVLVSLTEDGAAMAAQVDDSLEELEDVVRELPEQEQVVVLGALNVMAHSLVRRGRIQAYETCWRCRFFQSDARPTEPNGLYHCTLMNRPLSAADSNAECPDFQATTDGRNPLSRAPGGEATCS